VFGTLRDLAFAWEWRKLVLCIPMHDGACQLRRFFISTISFGSSSSTKTTITEDFLTTPVVRQRAHAEKPALLSALGITRML